MAEDRDIEGSSLKAIIANEIRTAQTLDQSKRALAIEYMRGEMSDLPARPNGSSQTSRDVSDIISWILPGVMRVWTASDRMVEFEATQPGGEQGAEEATEYTNYSFFRENDGYRLLYNATYDSLLLGNATVCSDWCPEDSKTKLYRDKTAEELAVLLEEGWQGLGVMPEQTGADETGQPTYTVRLKLVTERGYIHDECLKPENVLLNASATTFEDARFAAYLHDDMTRSDLVSMADEYGWDKAVIEKLPSYSRRNANEVTIARNALMNTDDNAPTRSGELIDLYRCFVRADRDDDGEAELLQVWYAGNGGQGEVLSEDEWEGDIPFTDIPCYPVPHSWQAEGVYDRAADIQRVKTVLLRQALDNNYAVNMPMREVEEGSVLNPDILTSPKFGGIIWKKKSTAPVVNYETAFIADKAFAAMEYMDTMISKRTGVSKVTMALDPEALQNQSATGTQLQHDAGYSQIELVARNMAELGWAKFFSKRRNLAKRYVKGASIPTNKPNASQPYSQVQPENWSDDMACTINVGLGTGSRDRDMLMLSSIQNDQMVMANMLGQYGFSQQALEFLPKIIKTATQKAESSGLKNPDSYYPVIDEQTLQGMKQQAAQPQPDPAVQLEQMKQQGAMQLEQMRGETQAQLKQVDAQVSAHEAELRAQGDVVKNKAELEADLQTRAADRENAIIIEQVKQAGALQIERERIASNERIKQAELAHQAAEAQAARDNAVHIASMKPKPGAAPN